MSLSFLPRPMAGTKLVYGNKDVGHQSVTILGHREGDGWIVGWVVINEHGEIEVVDSLMLRFDPVTTSVPA